MDELYSEVATDLNAQVKAQAERQLNCYACESNALWSIVGFKDNKKWLWVVQDRGIEFILSDLNITGKL